MYTNHEAYVKAKEEKQAELNRKIILVIAFFTLIGIWILAGLWVLMCVLFGLWVINGALKALSNTLKLFSGKAEEKSNNGND